MKRKKLKMHKYYIFILVASVCLANVGLLTFQPGNEFQVNTYTEGTQWRHNITMDSKGNFIIIWNNTRAYGLGKFGSYFQRFKNDGKHNGEETQVFEGFWEGKDEDIAMDKRGNFVIAYSKNLKRFSTDIFAQKFKKNGKQIGSEIDVNTNNFGYQGDSAIAMNQKGNFVIAWGSKDYDGSKSGIFAQRFNKKGTPLGSEFQVNTYYKSYQRNPAIALDRKGNFVVAWESNQKQSKDNPNFDLSTFSVKNYSIFAQRFDKNGLPLGDEFKVNTYNKGDQYNPAVAMNLTGDFVITWQSEKQDGEGLGIFAQIYNNNGEPVGPEFQVNSTIFKDQSNPSIAMDSEGNFVIVWESYHYVKAWKRYFDIFGQRFDSDGTLIGTEFLVNTYIQDNQNYPSIAMDPKGNFVVAWESENQDGSRQGIFAKMFKNE